MNESDMEKGRSHWNQFKPLTSSPSPTQSPFNNHNHQAISERQIVRVRKYVKICGCISAILCILAVIVIVLGFTVYNVKEPEVRMNKVTFLNGNITINGITSPDGNLTMLTDLSVKNTNAFTLRFGTTKVRIFYDGKEIGEGMTPPGKAKARRTQRFNVTMDVMGTRLKQSPNLNRDIRSDQALNISSYTKIDGNVKIFNIFRRSVTVEMNCTIQYNVTTSLITKGDNCLGRVSM